MLSAENSANDSAQSPACSRKPLPSATRASDAAQRARLAREHERRHRAQLVERGCRARRRRASRAAARPRVAPPARGLPRRGSAADAVRRHRVSEVRAGRAARRAAPSSSARRWRISSNCCWACICWVNSVAWMPWKSPSSQPTSWACAMRSSASLGVVARERQRHVCRAPCADRRRGSLELVDRALVDLLERAAAGVVERRAAGLVEQRAHHRRDADELGRPGDLLALGLPRSRHGVERVDDFGVTGLRGVGVGHGAPGSAGWVSICRSRPMQVTGRGRLAPRIRDSRIRAG